MAYICLRVIFYKSDGVVHIAVNDYDYDEEDNEDEEIFKEDLAVSIPGPNDVPVLNLEI